MSKKFSVPRGTTDILPAEMSLWQDVQDTARQIFTNYNYKEIQTPAFEEMELFARSMGKTSDVVQKQMLNLQSQKKSDAGDIHSGELSLRPEGTASVVRMYIENALDRKENISKFFYIGPMFRGERPQKGRLRQFHQIGVEVIGPGASHPYLDAEVIALNVGLLKAFGLKDFELKINTLGTLDNKGNIRELLLNKLKPKTKELCGDCQERIGRNVFRVLDCKNKSCQKIVKGIGLGYDWLDDESMAYFVQVKEGLDALGVKYKEDPSLVRGLDYYTHTVFEITGSSMGSQDAVSAGGRYDHLVSQLGGAEVPAIGFALGIERTILAMGKSQELAVTPPDAYIVGLDDLSFKKGFEVLSILRSMDISSDMSFRVSSMKSQMRLADKVGARSVIIMGELELEKECVALKDMETGDREEVSIKNNDYAGLVDKLRESQQ